jgi:L-cystine uptake protein TcyP (sodium:dicarboxylate symporter family)
MTVFLIGAGVSGVMLGATNRIIFLLPAELMALVVASVLIVRSVIDLGLTALTATLFCQRLFTRRSDGQHAAAFVRAAMKQLGSH